MDKQTYSSLENYMLSCMGDSAHDKEHIYRVLYHALEIAKTEENVDFDVLIAASLLHDIGRKEQYENPGVCHAMAGGEKAYAYLAEQGFGEGFAERVKHCIQTHRFRENHLPQSIEAKILFDADKLDAAGAMGVARTLLYQGIVTAPLYSVYQDGTVSDGTEDTQPSFLQEYKYKLEKLYNRFYTEKGRKLAEQRRWAAVQFYENLYNEARMSHENGKYCLNDILK